MISIAAGDGRLIASAEGQPTIELIPLDRARFVGAVLDLFDVWFEFNQGTDGEVEGMTAEWEFTTTEGPKTGQ
jgi:hypothetical protein